ncbi:MAG: alpha-glucosidase/alpha-galactosidase, partial [Firmicutes bacterium]|nr:alpha-glucosidase/alpha-galactosidase [Bacillota bacterium]
INVQKLTVKAAIEKDKTSIFHALLLDPLTSATLTIDEIQRMLDEIFQLEKEYGYLEDFK